MAGPNYMIPRNEIDRDRSQEIRPELDLIDESNPNSLINMLPDKMAEHLRKIPSEVLLLGDKALERAGNIQITEKRLRHAFWLEYNYAQLGKRKIALPNIYNGVCRKEQWFHDVVKDKWKLAYILTPPPDYKVAREEMLSLGMEQMREILETPHMVTNLKTGITAIDVRIANAKIKIYDTLSAQVYGAPVQKVQLEGRTLHAHMDVLGEGSDTLESLEQQIKAAQARLGPSRKEARGKEKLVTEISEEEMPEVRVNELESSEQRDASGEDSSSEL